MRTDKGTSFYPFIAESQLNSEHYIPRENSMYLEYLESGSFRKNFKFFLKFMLESGALELIFIRPALQKMLLIKQKNLKSSPVAAMFRRIWELFDSILTSPQWYYQSWVRKNGLLSLIWVKKQDFGSDKKIFIFQFLKYLFFLCMFWSQKRFC